MRRDVCPYTNLIGSAYNLPQSNKPIGLGWARHVAHTAEILTSSIVAVGGFNPAIFSPDWLERNKLIGEDDAAAAREGSHAKALLVSHQVSAFESDWFALQVLENQFSLTSKGALSPAFKDLAAGIFQLVSHTPVAAVGLNFTGHFKLASFDEYHKVGDVLAPKDIWNSLYADESAGMEQVTILFKRGTREKPEHTKDEKRITVQPSRSLKYGVTVSINDHHDVTTASEENLTPAERVALIISSQWEPALNDAVSVFDKVISMALAM